MHIPRPPWTVLSIALALFSSQWSLPAAPAPPPLQQVASGPWGDLEYFSLILEPPDYYVRLSHDLRRWPEGTVWKLAAKDADEAARILVSSGIEEALARKLAGPDYLSKTGESDLVEIRPPEEVILGLTPDQRRQLYPHMQPEDNTNPFHQPFALRSGGIRAVTGIATGVPREQLDLIERLTYQEGEARNFSDVALVFGKARDDDERFRILKTLGREPSLSVRLRLAPSSDVSRLADYWSAGGRNKEVLPLLESVLETPGVDTVDIVHFLPPVPRKLLFTFPSPQGEGMGEDMPDCFWTAFSFFSENPPDRLFDFVDHVFQERYQTAEPPYRLGDLVLIHPEEGEIPVHACNVIADNLVYTKNGQSMGRPWIISTIEDLQHSYNRTGNIRLQYARLKPEYRK